MLQRQLTRQPLGAVGVVELQRHGRRCQREADDRRRTLPADEQDEVGHVQLLIGPVAARQGALETRRLDVGRVSTGWKQVDDVVDIGASAVVPMFFASASSAATSACWARSSSTSV